jgi:hypothetical protein
MIYIDVIGIYPKMTWGYTVDFSVPHNSYLKIGDTIKKSESEMWIIKGRDGGLPAHFTNYEHVSPDNWVVGCLVKPLAEGIEMKVGDKLYK